MNNPESDVDFTDSNDVDFYSNKISPHDESNEVGETLYASQSLNKGKRFYFVADDRKDGDQMLGHVAKQTGWHYKTDAILNITYPTKDQPPMKLNYVFLVVIQESEINRINIYEGGIGQTNIGIMIRANATRYLQYNATFYGVP